MSEIFGDDFDLSDVKDLIINLGINPLEAKNQIIQMLQEKFGKDKTIVTLHHDQNPSISRKMNYFINNGQWYIRVRKEKGAELVQGDFVKINIDFSGMTINKIIFSIETKRNKLAQIGVCQMHETRLGTKVSYNL